MNEDEFSKQKIFEVALFRLAIIQKSVNCSEYGRSLSRTRAFCISGRRIIFLKSNASNTNYGNSLFACKFYLRALLCRIMVQGGKEGENGAV